MQKIFYVLAIILTIVSFCKDKEKTKIALKKGWKAFEAILPTVLCVMAVVGISLSLIDESVIANVIGPSSGVLGVIVSIFIGSITMMGGFIAFPLGATLISKGAGVSQVGAFISALMLVGILTIPIEKKYWGMKTTLLRNILGIIISFAVAIALEVIL